MTPAQRVHGLWPVMPGTSPSVLVSKSVFMSVMWDVGVEYRPRVLETVVVTLIHSPNLVILKAMSHEISF